MLNKTKSFVSIALLSFAFSTPALALDLKEGTDFQVVTANVQQDNDVRVYFSFRCWHCATMDSVYAEIAQQLPKDVCVKKVPVFSPNDKLDILYTKGFAVAESCNKDKEYTQVLFDALKANEAPQCMNTLTELLAKELDIEPLEFQKQFMAKETNDKLHEYMNDIERMKINAVPAVIIGNQYQVLPKRVTSFQEYKDLVENLVNKKLTEAA
ncbi:thioredoxin domain-containing protein [Vibrio tapetis]|uniref:Thiol:disulfide interchange protein n=1 Tax=Vibrio tapetis subsp. tapetis TaxID=1671868 RepID=A0A2N8ZKF4_9VIBR|nr:thioredoxin domain-containing protein [Vibrio tapetis]SON52391.1 conserved exported protein of unknown function [Vibrio tapetis subsp. tapetis]